MAGSTYRGAALLLGFVALIGGAPAALACRICFPLPKQSLADHLIAGQDAVLAREDPERPFHYRSIRVLKGSAPEAPLDLFLDSTKRRIIAANPEQTVLLVRTEQWRRVLVVDRALRPIVEEIVKRAPEWQRDSSARLNYFVKLYGDDDADVRELAHLEVARAPYGEIRRIGRRLPRARVRMALRDPRYMEWWSLHILLLGQSGDERDRERIVDTVRSLARFRQSTQLAAWATAYIEVEGDAAIEFLEQAYARPDRQVEELDQVVLALSVHGKYGSEERRNRVVAAYKALLTRHPALASPILDDLIAWDRRDMASWMEAFGKRHTRDLQPDARIKLRRFTTTR